MKIVLPDKINISDSYIQQIEDLGAKVYHDLPSNEELIERIKDAEIITACYVDITPKEIDAAPNLKYIIVPAVGYEWVDVEYAASKGITTLNCPTFNGQAVAEYAVSLLMATNRQLRVGADTLRDGGWNPQTLVGYELEGKQVGLIGHGNIGKRIEKILQALGMNVSYVNSSSTEQDVDNLVESSDYLIVCAPLTESTKNMLDARRLGMMKTSAVLVNVGRGAIVDQKALFAALKDNKIRGAGLDVFDGEPLTGEPSDEIVELARLPNVLATPHMAYNTVEMQDKQGQEILDNIIACIEDIPQNTVRKGDA